MEHIRLDGARWSNADDFYTAYLAAVGAPEWHGRNLDAVWDSLTGGDINQRNPPYLVRITGTTRMSTDALQVVERYQSMIQEAHRSGVPVQVELLP